MKRMSDQITNSKDSGGIDKSSLQTGPSEKLSKGEDELSSNDGAGLACATAANLDQSNVDNSNANGGVQIIEAPKSPTQKSQGSSNQRTTTTGDQQENQQQKPPAGSQETRQSPMDGGEALATTAAATGAAESSTSKMEKSGEKVTFALIFGKAKYDIVEFLDENVTNLKETVAKLTGVPPSMQKLMYKGMLKDGQTLRDAKLTDGCKVMLIGSTPTQVAAANTAPKPEELSQAEAQAAAKEPLCRQKQHVKVLEKGLPEDVMPGIKNARDSLPQAPISGMINARGSKVRLTFKLELDQVWIGTKERTDKIMMSQIKDVISEPIEGHEEYHIMGLQLGPTEASRYWLYWVPAQYVASIKAAIVG